MSDDSRPLFFSFAYGTILMLCIHNFLVSIDHYRNVRSFSILKIIYNFSSSLEIIFLFIYEIIESDESMNACRIFTYLLAAATFIRCETLAIFLLWRLKRIVDTRWDKFICYFLLFIRTCFQMIYGISIHIVNQNSPNYIGLVNSCGIDLTHVRSLSYGFVITDLFIDIYVVARTVQILTKGSRKAAQVDLITGRTSSNRKLFNKIICWNYSRLASATSFNIITLFMFFMSNRYTNIPLRILRMINYFAISYLITIDKEIVRVIVGKGDKDFEAGKVHIIYDYTIENSRYSISITKNLPQKKTISNKIITSFNSDVKLDENIIQSKQKLTFVEWAFMVGWDIQGLEDERSIERPRSRSVNTLEIEDQ